MTPKLQRTVLRARLALFWERLWAASYPLLMVLALFAMAVLTGILAALPDLVRYGALAAFVLAFLWALRPLASLAIPARSEGLRRIEQASSARSRRARTGLPILHPRPRPSGKPMSPASSPA